MKRLEVLVKYAKPKKPDVEETEEEKEQKRLNRIIGKDDYMEDEGIGSKIENMFSEKNLEFFYKPYVIKVKDVLDFTPYDEEHTLVLTKYGGQLPIKMGWHMWKAVWEYVSGEVILDADSAVKSMPEKKKNNQKQL